MTTLKIRVPEKLRFFFPGIFRISDIFSAMDIQKKMKRAERFRMPVSLSEEEKTNSRAERFVTASAANGLDSSNQSEDLKRKAGAERFGTVKSVSADEEAKTKARLARFGSAPVAESAEEDKKKAIMCILTLPICYTMRTHICISISQVLLMPICEKKAAISRSQVIFCRGFC